MTTESTHWGKAIKKEFDDLIDFLEHLYELEQKFARISRHAFELRDRGFIDRRLKAYVEDATRFLVSKAEEEFSVDGFPLDVDESVCQSALQLRAYKGEIRQFDPVEIWDEFVRQYGSNRGQDVALGQIAARILRELGDWVPGRGPASISPRQLRGRCVITKYVYLDNLAKELYGHNVLGFDGARTWVALTNDLNEFFRWANLASSEVENEFSAFLRGGDGIKSADIQSREKLAFNDHLVITTYLSKFELSFTEEAFGMLQAFLSMYSENAAA